MTDGFIRLARVRMSSRLAQPRIAKRKSGAPADAAHARIDVESILRAPHAEALRSVTLDALSVPRAIGRERTVPGESKLLEAVIDRRLDWEFAADNVIGASRTQEVA